MLVELAARIGPSLDWWIDRPLAYALYAFRHLQELDRRHEWAERLHRIELASLIALAFHEPAKLDLERRAAIQDAASVEIDDQTRERARRMVADIAAGGVLH